MEASTSAMHPPPTSSTQAPPKIIAGSKSQTAACQTCTFLNPGDAKVCGMCEAQLTPPTHDVQANGTWRCGSCSNLNRKGLKDCHQCHTPFYSSVTSTAPSQIFCSKCGFLNDGDNPQCVQCDNQLRSTLDKIGTDLRDSTNFIARDMGMNINVKCPGCLVVCFVPPATAGLRCGSCHTYFASPTVGEVTNFHMARLATSITSSFRGFFSRGSRSAPASDQEAEVPVGRLLAIGGIAQRRNNGNNNANASSSSMASSSSSSSSAGGGDSSVLPSSTDSFSAASGFSHEDNVDENEEKDEYDASSFSQQIEIVDARERPQAAAEVEETHDHHHHQGSSPRRQAAVVETRRLSPKATAAAAVVAISPRKQQPYAHNSHAYHPLAVAVTSATQGGHHHHSTSACPMALHASDPQDMIKVEGDIVEL